MEERLRLSRDRVQRDGRGVVVGVEVLSPVRLMKRSQRQSASVARVGAIRTGPWTHRIELNGFAMGSLTKRNSFVTVEGA